MMNLFLLLACSGVKDPHDHDHDHDHDHEVITRIVLDFTDSNGDTQQVTWSDPENDGDPVVDDIVLLDSETYDVQVSFWNDMSEPAEEITPEIVDEADEHQVFVTPPSFVDVVNIDTDENGLELGLEQEWSTTSTGSDTLTLGLRHMPLEDGVSVKVEDMDLANLPGAWDVNIDFTITVE